MIQSSTENSHPEPKLISEQKMIESTSAQVAPMQCYAPFSGSPLSELYNMDCVAGMKHYPDKYFDLAIVDPPYGLGDKLTTGGTWASKYKTGDAAWDIKPPYEYFCELFRVSKNQIVWGANYFKDLPECRCFLIWDKVALMDTMADCEFAWTSFDKNAKIFRHVRNTSETRIHICQKPIKLYEWILSKFAEPGQRILDTHVGSGSSRIACYLNGFDFVGFEIDEDYCQSSEKRFRNAIKQQRLF